MSGTGAADSLQQKLSAIHQQIDRGQLADAAHALSHLGNVKPTNDQDYEGLVRAILVLAMFGFGDMERARQVNGAVPLSYRPDLRYRLALRQNDWRLAKRLRSQSGLAEDVIRDFHWSASHRMLWSNRRRCGLRLYDNRVYARNFTKILPSWLRYQPFRPEQPECPALLVEQGIGDALVHLSHFMAQRTRQDHVVFGLPAMVGVIKRLLPDAQFVDITDARNAEQWAGTEVHAAADYMVAGYLATGSLRAAQPLFPRHGRRLGPPLFGLSWRGGSGQNRRDERTMPLWMLLDLLPEDGQFVVLQHDLTEAETALIARASNVMQPHMKLHGAGEGLLDLVADLAGVITVDNTNLHIAGATGTPIFALMNPRKHWYFMPDGEVSNIYPDAVTHPIGQARAEDIAAFMARASQAPVAPMVQHCDGPPPILVTAPPRSRTSMVMGALHAGGLWTGETVAATRENPRGFFENRSIRERVIKPGLELNGFDPLGVRRFPPRSYDAPWPGLAEQVTRHLRDEGWDGQQLWGMKDPKLLLAWRQWARAFPEALWVLPTRPDDQIIASCLKTSFMMRHSHQPVFWQSFVTAHRMREAELLDEVNHVLRIDVTAWKAGEINAEAESAFAERGLNIDAMRQFLLEGIA